MALDNIIGKSEFYEKIKLLCLIITSDCVNFFNYLKSVWIWAKYKLYMGLVMQQVKIRVNSFFLWKVVIKTNFSSSSSNFKEWV